MTPSSSRNRSRTGAGTGRVTPGVPRLVREDPYLIPYADQIRERMRRIDATEKRLTGGRISLADFASGHEYFGLHRRDGQWVFREWAPNATAVFLRGDFSGWDDTPRYQCKRIGRGGVWELHLPPDALRHDDHYKLGMHWPGGHGERIPAYARRVEQDPETQLFAARVWAPAEPYVWTCPRFSRPPEPPLVYEAHVGMAQQEAKIGSYREFRENVLPRIVRSGYNTLQLMAIQEHPYYGSFGYHVANFFAASSRFGTPRDLKELIDAAHQAGLAVLMDLVLSHAVRNELEGLGRFDGTTYQFFHEGARGVHTAWDSCCFDYGKPEVLHFLLSNCRFWLDEYKFDGFRVDGVTSMLYRDHGLGRTFSSYDQYFSDNADPDAAVFLALANAVVHSVRPDAITIAEDVSGTPGAAAPRPHGGLGFDYRLAMGVPDYWIKIIKEQTDEQWDMGAILHELTNRRSDEKTIAYAESHDQALVGDQTLIFRLIGADMYHGMQRQNTILRVERGVALHKMIRFVTLTTAGHGYLNFMGNEFGHPEWIDFPREGNDWSCHYARRQWRLADDRNLKYHGLCAFDRDMIALARQTNLLTFPDIAARHRHHGDQVLAFERGNLLFVFNFNPAQSFTDYGIPCQPGRYVLALNSDAREYEGHGRLRNGSEHFSNPLDAAPGQTDHQVLLYLPTRTALALRRDEP